MMIDGQEHGQAKNQNSMEQVYPRKQQTVSEQPGRRMVDITDQVCGKIVGQRMHLYLNEVEIGSFSLISPPVEFQLREGYGLQEGSLILYQIQEVGKKDSQYVDGCDLGWC